MTGADASETCPCGCRLEWHEGTDAEAAIPGAYVCPHCDSECGVNESGARCANCEAMRIKR